MQCSQNNKWYVPPFSHFRFNCGMVFREISSLFGDRLTKNHENSPFLILRCLIAFQQKSTSAAN